MSLKTLKKALENKLTDDFEVGDVIRWYASGKYLYSALKTEVGWFTSARDYNPFVPQRVSFDELVEILQRSETSDIAVSTGWEFI